MTHDDLFPAEIFICYSHQDRALVDDLIANLKDASLKALTFWFDRSIDRGAKWKDEIDTHLLSSLVVLVIATVHSNTSTWCTYEWARALGMGKTVIPLIYSADHIHEKLSEINGFDFNQGQRPYPEIKQRLIQLYQAQRLSPTLRMFNELLNGRDNLPSPADFVNVAFELGLVTDRQYQEVNRWLRNLIGQRMKSTTPLPALSTKPSEDKKKTQTTGASRAPLPSANKPAPPGNGKLPATDVEKPPALNVNTLTAPDSGKTTASNATKLPEAVPPKPPEPTGKTP